MTKFGCLLQSRKRKYEICRGDGESSLWFGLDEEMGKRGRGNGGFKEERGR